MQYPTAKKRTTSYSRRFLRRSHKKLCAKVVILDKLNGARQRFWLNHSEV